MAEDRYRANGTAGEDSAAGDDAAGGPAPAGPYLRDYGPAGPVRPTSARTALVLFYRNGGHSVATVSGVQHYDKRALARPFTICEIALGTFETTLQMELPAAGGATFFKAEVDIHWSVTDPHLAAVAVVTDVAKRLTAPTLERLREVSADFPVNRAEEANRAITGHCAGGRWDDLGGELGLRVRLYVRLRVDDRTIHHVEGIRDANASAELTQVRQNRILTMLQGGELFQLSYMMATDPETRNFLEKIRQEGRQDEKDRVERIFAMVAGGQLHSNEVESQALDLLNHGQRSVHGRPAIQGPIGSLPARRDTPRLEPSREAPFTPDWVADEPPAGADRRTRPADDSGDTDHVEDIGDTDRFDGIQDAAPRPPRRRSRDDGWSWAEEDQ
ncbi:hypothetical protein ACFY7Z_07670 [Streptomyces sp. NPDC012623]|uniref:hypothetical protein n=1 Tax=unclassified Streptomyces TaxID=2593676 RepID=UPI0036C41D3B